MASTTTSAKTSPWPANSAWPGPKGSGPIRWSASPRSSWPSRPWPTTPTPWRIWGGHPPVPRHLPPAGAARRPRQGAGQPGARRPAAHQQGRRAVQGRLWLPAAPVVLDRAKQYMLGPITYGICGQDFQPKNAGHQDHA